MAVGDGARVSQEDGGPMHVRLDAAIALERAVQHHVQDGCLIQCGDLEAAESMRAATVDKHLRSADGNIRRIARALFHRRVVIRVRSRDGEAPAPPPHLHIVERLAHDDVLDPAVLGIALEGAHGIHAELGCRGHVLFPNLRGCLRPHLAPQRVSRIVVHATHRERFNFADDLPPEPRARRTLGRG